ncbi:MAG TPA: 3-oxoacyl-[acyl-carrier-protein] synthase III C-terminal domain-containing protein [Pseudonocardiaceae bacterium]|jgi:3-oxoacyl-[acyl-carrier-protein] synthase-3
MTIALSRVSVGLPDRMESVEDILARNDRPVTERRLFTKVYKLRQSPTLQPGEQMADLIVRTGRAALGGERATMVLYGHTLLLQEFGYRGGFAKRLRGGLGLPGVPFYGVSHIACTSVLRSVELARAYLMRPEADPDDTVLLLGGDHGSVVDSARIVPGMTVGGDAAIGVLVHRGPGRYRYLGGALARDSRFHRSLRMSHDDLRLFSQVCCSTAISVMNRALADAGITQGDVDWVMPHLSNAMFWRTFSNASGIAMDKFCLDLISEQGHTFGADALMALAHMERTGRLEVGQRCLLIALGQGAYFQAVVVEIGADR